MFENEFNKHFGALVRNFDLNCKKISHTEFEIENNKFRMNISYSIDGAVCKISVPSVNLADELIYTSALEFLSPDSIPTPPLNLWSVELILEWYSLLATKLIIELKLE